MQEKSSSYPKTRVEVDQPWPQTFRSLWSCVYHLHAPCMTCMTCMHDTTPLEVRTGDPILEYSKLCFTDRSICAWLVFSISFDEFFLLLYLTKFKIFTFRETNLLFHSLSLWPKKNNKPFNSFSSKCNIHPQNRWLLSVTCPVSLAVKRNTLRQIDFFILFEWKTEYPLGNHSTTWDGLHGDLWRRWHTYFPPACHRAILLKFLDKIKCGARAGHKFSLNLTFQCWESKIPYTRNISDGKILWELDMTNLPADCFISFVK